jgi:hypothetical protein
MWRGTKGGAEPWRAIDEATRSCGARARQGGLLFMRSKGHGVGQKGRRAWRLGAGGEGQGKTCRWRRRGVWRAGEKGRGRPGGDAGRAMQGTCGAAGEMHAWRQLRRGARGGGYATGMQGLGLREKGRSQDL